jgi:hypothetical protein
MVEGRRPRTIGLHALLIATIIQGMTAESYSLASPALLHRLAASLADGPCGVPDERSPSEDASGPFRDLADEATSSEVCVSEEPGAVAVRHRHLPGSSRSGTTGFSVTERFVPSNSRLPDPSRDVARSSHNLLLTICRLSC